MHRRKFLTGVGTASVIGLAGCGGNGGDGEGSPTDGGGTEGTDGGGGGGGGNTIEMRTDGSENLFDPIGLFVEPGSTVTWINVSGAHSSTAYVEGTGGATVTRIPEGADGWNSETLNSQGAQFQHTLETQGTYDYFCIPHKTMGMVGRLVVGEPSGIDGDPPDGPVPSEQQIVEQGSIGWEEFTQ